MNVFRMKRTLRAGVKSLWLHKLRSLLTTLGIVFGVCSVVAMLAIGEGASFEVQEQIKQLGSNNIIIRSVKPAEDEKASGSTTGSFSIEYGLTYDDAERIATTNSIPRASESRQSISKDGFSSATSRRSTSSGAMPSFWASCACVRP